MLYSVQFSTTVHRFGNRDNVCFYLSSFVQRVREGDGVKSPEQRETQR